MAIANWDTPPEDFRYILFERVDRAENMARYYLLGWQPTLFDQGAVIRVYGRKNGFQRVLIPQPFDSLDEAWPFLRSIIKTRLRHNYRIVQSEVKCRERS